MYNLLSHLEQTYWNISRNHYRRYSIVGWDEGQYHKRVVIVYYGCVLLLYVYWSRVTRSSGSRHFVLMKFAIVTVESACFFSCFLILWFGDMHAE